MQQLKIIIIFKNVCIMLKTVMNYKYFYFTYFSDIFEYFEVLFLNK